jgi:hypothetical protein
VNGRRLLKYHCSINPTKRGPERRWALHVESEDGIGGSSLVHTEERCDISPQVYEV